MVAAPRARSGNELTTSHLRGSFGPARRAESDDYRFVYGRLVVNGSSCSFVGCASIRDTLCRGAIHRGSLCNGTVNARFGGSNPRRRYGSLSHGHSSGAGVSWCRAQQGSINRDHLTSGDFHSGDDFWNVLPGKRGLVTRPAAAYWRRKEQRRRKRRRTVADTSAGEQRSIRSTRLKSTLERVL